jgi:hypothetical protein
MESLTEFRSSGVGTDKFPELLFFGFHIENSGETESGPKGGDDRGLTSPATTDMLISQNSSHESLSSSSSL